MRDDLDREIQITPLACNWLQCMDNSLDPIHFEHLHGAYGNYVMKKPRQARALSPARHLKIAFDVFEYGIYKRRLVEGRARGLRPTGPSATRSCSRTSWRRAGQIRAPANCASRSTTRTRCTSSSAASATARAARA